MPHPPLIHIDPDITRAETLPGRVYADPTYYAVQLEKVFAASWQLVGDVAVMRAPGKVFPFVLLDGCLSEPLVLASDEHGTVRCLSNVCTHRGALVVEGE